MSFIHYMQVPLYYTPLIPGVKQKTCRQRANMPFLIILLLIDFYDNQAKLIKSGATSHISKLPRQMEKKSIYGFFSKPSVI